MRNYNNDSLNENTTTFDGGDFVIVGSERITKERKADEYKQRRDNRQTKRWKKWSSFIRIPNTNSLNK